MIRFDFSFEKVLEWGIVLAGATLVVLIAVLVEAKHPLTYMLAAIGGGGAAYLAIDRVPPGPRGSNEEK